MRRQPDMAGEMLERLTNGAAHDDAYQLITIARDGTYDDPIALAQAEILADHARAATAAIYLSGLAAQVIENYAQALGYDADALLTGLAIVRPPYVA